MITGRCSECAGRTAGNCACVWAGDVHVRVQLTDRHTLRGIYYLMTSISCRLSAENEPPTSEQFSSIATHNIPGSCNGDESHKLDKTRFIVVATRTVLTRL